MSSSQEYFVPGFGISRQVMFSHLQFYLGPYASVRPYSYQNQIEDLQNLSRQYEEQAAQRMSMSMNSSSSSSSTTTASSNDSEQAYINRPVPVVQRERRRWSPEGSSRRGR
ncbi:MAG: hypothetical protein M1830_000007 [Pleopsidium flavum]|nr:MAG: hypothetical protein M1830_000007 [Pleopsidium flavum]